MEISSFLCSSVFKASNICQTISTRDHFLDLPFLLQILNPNVRRHTQIVRFILLGITVIQIYSARLPGWTHTCIQFILPIEETSRCWNKGATRIYRGI